VTLRRRHGTVELTISDNGTGISPEDACLRTGIIGMRYRIEAAGGRLKIVSSVGQGTCIHATIPDGEAAPFRDSASLSIPGCRSRSRATNPPAQVYRINLGCEARYFVPYPVSMPRLQQVRWTQTLTHLSAGLHGVIPPALAAVCRDS
jgi:hypothetical protein